MDVPAAAADESEEPGAIADGFVELASVMGIVVPSAQRDQLVVVGLPAEEPVVDVMDLHVACHGAARVAAALVPVFHQAAGPLGDDALGAAHADGLPIYLPYGDDLAFAGELLQ